MTQKTRKSIAVLFFAIGVVFSIEALALTERRMSTGFNPDWTVRLFEKWDNWTPMLEYQGNHIQGLPLTQTVTLGSYNNAIEGFRWGIFYRRLAGWRYEEDLFKDANGWQWKDSSRRAEDQLVVDVTPRAAWTFLPGENWLGEFKLRWYQTLENPHRATLSMRPGVNYAWLRQDQPFINFYLQYEVLVPVNYAQSLLSAQWAYIGSLYHFQKWMQVGLYLARQRQDWMNERIHWMTQSWLVGGLLIFKRD